ncbi:MAG: dephospho-CoA kinase [Myxococcales bacterium]|nr:dephospho-CoA kinase [Myxococcales bacterium]
MAQIVGLTGGIASGKSTVARLLTDLGATVIDADAIVHELQAPAGPLLGEMVEAFGPEILDADGALDRPALGALVFRDAAARERLGRIVHPKVGAEMLRRIAAARAAGARLIVLDIPLLFEGRAAGTGSAARMALDATIVVSVPERVQVARQMARDGCDRDEALRRVRAQLPLEDKKRLASYVIDNSGSRAETERQVRNVFAALTAAAAP